MEQETPAKNFNRSYAVFLSYRHADNKETGRQWATWLHQMLEGYEIPADLVGTKNSKGELIPASLYPVFRDEEELPADADLTRNIRQALENSGLLVVLCSPRAVESRFVADEIRYFKEIGKSDRILALMIDGEPNAADDPGKAKLGIKPEMECLPEPLRFGVAGDDRKIDWSRRTEPIAADVRPEGNAQQGWTTGAAYREALQKKERLPEKEISQKVRDYEQRLELAKLKVVAGSLGVPLGVLTQRDKAMQLRKARQRARTLKLWLAAVGVLALLAAAGGIYAWFQRQEAIAQRLVAEAQRKEALKTASATDFAIADLKLQSGNHSEALAYLSRSLRNDPANVTSASRLVSLCRSLPFCISKLSHDSIVGAASFSPDGNWIVTASGDTARVWDARTGNAVGEPMRHGGDANAVRFINTVSFSPDGKWVATASWDKTARIWDARTGNAVGEPMRHGDTVKTARFSPDGKWIVTASDDKTARVWDARTGNAVGEPMRHGEIVESASFSPDGRWVVTASDDKTARVWDARTGNAVGEPMRHEDSVKTASFSPDGKWIVTASADKTARVWDAQTGQAVGEPMRHQNFVNSARFSPDGKWILTVSWDTTRVWDAQTGKPMGEPMRHENAVNDANFSPDGKWIVTGSRFAARVLDARTGEPVSEPMRHEDIVSAASFSPDGKWIITASWDKTARIWETQTGMAVGEAMRHDGFVIAASFSPDGKWIVAASEDKTARVWDAQTGKPVSEPMRPVGAARFSPDGKWIVTGSDDKTARVWDAQTGKAVGEPMRHADLVFGASFSPDGKWIVTASADKTARVWNAQTHKPVGEPMRHEDTVRTASFSPDGKWIVTASADKTARVWDAQTGKPVGKPMRHHNVVYAANFSPDGKSIVTASWDRVRVWDAQTGNALAEPMRFEDNVNAVSFSPDGKWIVAASRHTARVCEAQSGKAVGEPMRHQGTVTSASFSPDGRWIVTASEDKTARVWDAQTGKPAGEPMRHESTVFAASFSPDGKWIVSANDRTVRVWEAGIFTEEAPDWLMTLAETVGGKHFNTNGVPEPFDPSLFQFHGALRNLTGNDDLSRFGRWFVAEPSQRTISPLSSITVPEFVSQRLQENTPDSLGAAYRIDPGNPLVVVSLAKLEADKDKALFLCRYALHRARIEGQTGKIERVRAIARSIFPTLPEFGDASP